MLEEWFSGIAGSVMKEVARYVRVSPSLVCVRASTEVARMCGWTRLCLFPRTEDYYPEFFMMLEVLAHSSPKTPLDFSKT